MPTRDAHNAKRDIGDDDDDDDDGIDDEDDAALLGGMSSPMFAGGKKRKAVKIGNGSAAKRGTKTSDGGSGGGGDALGTIGLTAEELDEFNFGAALAARGLTSPTSNSGKPKRMPAKRNGGSAGKEGSVASKRGKGMSLEALLADAEEEAEAEARTMQILERRRADDAEIQRRKREELEKAKMESKREAEEALAKALEANDEESKFGETYVIEDTFKTLNDCAFASVSETVEAMSSDDSHHDLPTCRSRALVAFIKKARASVPDAKEGDLWRVLLLERWLPMLWSKRGGDFSDADEETFEWLWEVTTTCQARDVSLAARDTMLAALGFEPKWGSVYEGFSNYKVSAARRAKKFQAPEWDLCASTVCDTLRALGAYNFLSTTCVTPTKNGKQRGKEQQKGVSANKSARLRHQLFATLDLVAAVCDNAFERGAQCFDNIDGCARIIQILASFAVDPRSRPLDVHVKRAATSLLATVPSSTWSVFKTKAIRYLLDVTEITADDIDYDSAAAKVRIVEWLPCSNDRERDLRDSLAAVSTLAIRHLLPIDKEMSKASTTEISKFISLTSNDDVKSVIERRIQAVEILSRTRVGQTTDAREVWCVLSAIHLVDVVLNGGKVFEQEEDMVEGGLKNFMRFLSRKVLKSYRRSLSTLRTRLMAIKTRYERAHHVSMAALSAAKESVYDVDV